MSDEQQQEQDRPPRPERGIGVLEQERRRQQWHADRGEPDPVRREAEARLDRLHDDDN